MGAGAYPLPLFLRLCVVIDFLVLHRTCTTVIEKEIPLKQPLVREMHTNVIQSTGEIIHEHVIMFFNQIVRLNSTNIA